MRPPSVEESGHVEGARDRAAKSGAVAGRLCVPLGSPPANLRSARPWALATSCCFPPRRPQRERGPGPPLVNVNVGPRDRTSLPPPGELSTSAYVSPSLTSRIRFKGAAALENHVKLS
ncbi:unnamed protein product [Coccothraustes coccothraustes]